MSLKKLIEYASFKKEFPIKVDDIHDWIISQGYQDQIHFIPVDINKEVKRGQHRRYTKHAAVYGDPVWVTNILYAKDMNLCWERFVCCKEMMHIFDRPESASCTPEQLDELTASLVASYVGQLSESASADDRAIISALQVLAPIDAVKQLKGVYSGKSKSAKEIAKYFSIPEMYVPMLFSDDYRYLCEN